MAKKGCIVRIYAGGLFSSGRDLYVVSGQDGALIEVIVTPPSDGGPVTAAGYDFHDAVDLEVTKATYKRYLAHAKKNPASTRGKMPPADLPPPIPGMEGPFRYKTGFILYWDPREGKYYDRGKDVYLSIQEAEAAMGTKNPTRNSGYQLSSKQKKALDTYFAPSRERGEVPPDGKYTMEDLGIFWDDMDEHGLRAVRDAIDAYAAAPIPNKGPLRRRTATRDWIGKAITRPGKLGGAGFLSKSKAAQEKILRGCVTEYGYRSCLGSVMILERIPDIQNRWGARLAGLRHFLVRNFGGPGSFGPRKNPDDDPVWTVKSITIAPLNRETDDVLLEAMGVGRPPAQNPGHTDPRLLEVSDLFMAGLNRQALAKLKDIRPKACSYIILNVTVMTHGKQKI